MTDALPEDLCKRLEQLLSRTEVLGPESAVRERIGRLAVLQGYITLDQLTDALGEQHDQASRPEGPEKIGQILIRRGLIDAEKLERLLRLQAGARAGPPRLERFEICEKLGEGGLAAVYRALDRELGRPVAIKVLKESSSLHETARFRLRREAQALARMSHPNIVMVYDVGDHDGQLYLAIELVRGKTFRQLLRERTLDRRTMLEILAKVADGVHHAHEHGVVHRDIKPENILITESGEPKVADFGLAHLAESDQHLTRTGSQQGTPLYMAPEQVEGRSRDVTLATDVYALGAVLYEALAERPPFQGDTIAIIFSRILNEEPRSLRRIDSNIPPDLETIALKALSKEPARRYTSAREFAEDLRRHLAAEPILAQPAGLGYRLYRRARRNPSAFVLGIGSVLAGLVALMTWRSSIEGARSAERNRGMARETIRTAARLSLDSALNFRRLGANDRMALALPSLDQAYGRAVELAPDLAEIDYLLGRMHRALMQYDKALEYQERALAKDPRYAPALYERVVLVSHLYGGQLRNTYNPVPIPTGVEVTPASARRFADPTLPEIERGREDLAIVRERLIRDCEFLGELLLDDEVRSSAPVPISQANVLALKGILACHRGRFEEARSFLREAVEKDPLLEEAWESLAQGTAEAAAMEVSEKYGLWSQAVRLYDEALRHDRGYIPHLLGRADVLFMRGDDRMCRGDDPLADFAASEQDITEALRLRKGYASLLRGRGDLRAARGVYRAGRGEDPIPDWSAAMDDYDVVLASDPRNGSVLRRRGKLHVQLARYRVLRGEDPLAELDAAERDLSEALLRNDKESITWNWRGHAKLLRGAYAADRGRDPLSDYADAEKDLTEAIRLFVIISGPWRDRGHVRMLRGLYRMKRGEDPTADFGKAEEDLIEASERARRRPAHPGWLTSEFLPAWNLLARVRAEKGAYRARQGQEFSPEFESAEGALAEAFAFNPSDPEAFEVRGLVRSLEAESFERQGDGASAATYRAAEEDLRTAVRLNPFLHSRTALLLEAISGKVQQLER